MKSLEELNSIKAELNSLNEKLSSLSEEELSQVAGGDYWDMIHGAGVDRKVLEIPKPLEDNIQKMEIIVENKDFVPIHTKY